MIGASRRGKKLFNLLKKGKKGKELQDTVLGFVSAIEQDIDQNAEKFAKDRKEILERREELRQRMKRGGSIR